MIPEHLESGVLSTDAEAWLVDGFGRAHPVPVKMRVGRNPGNEIRILTSVVSHEHVELQRSGERWVVRDLGSHNGTYVNGERVQGKQELRHEAVLQVGNVRMFFLDRIFETHTEASPAETATLNEVVQFRIAPGDDGIEIQVAGRANDGSGTILSRRGTTEWIQRALPPLEFQMLLRLCTRAYSERNEPTTVRGCISSEELARVLPFQTRYANGENVRGTVRRLRGNHLDEIGAKGLLAHQPGRGYYLARSVTIGPFDES